jgi:hypothetical protein
MPGCLPGDGWVTEARTADGSLVVLPLVGWQVIGCECYPQPRSLDPTTIRPHRRDDKRLMVVTQARHPFTQTGGNYRPRCLDQRHQEAPSTASDYCRFARS